MRDQKLVVLHYGNLGDATTLAVLVRGARGGLQIRRWIDSARRFGRPKALGKQKVLGPAPAGEPRTARATEALDAEAKAAAAGRARLREQRGK